MVKKFLIMTSLLSSIIFASCCYSPRHNPKEETFPNWFKKTVEYHVKQIMENGNAEELSIHDFDHGHLILKDGKAKSLEELAKDTMYILYHTNENEVNNGAPYPKEKERSLLGFMDGKVLEARYFVKKNVLDSNPYKRNGTIYDHNIANFFSVKCEHKTFGNYLLIKADDKGEYSQNGQRFNIHLRTEKDTKNPTTKEEIYKHLGMKLPSE